MIKNPIRKTRPFLDVDASAKLYRSFRESKGYTVEYVANILGITVQSYYKYERGKNTPSNEHIYRLSKLYGVKMKNMSVMKGESPSFYLQNLMYNENFKREFVA